MRRSLFLAFPFPFALLACAPAPSAPVAAAPSIATPAPGESGASGASGAPADAAPKVTADVYCHLVDRVRDRLVADLRALDAKPGLTRDEARAALIDALPSSPGGKARFAEALQAEGITGEDVASFIHAHPADVERCSARFTAHFDQIVGSFQHLEAVLKGPAAPSLPWRADVDAAKREAGASKRPLLLRFSAAWSGADHELDVRTFADPDVVAAARPFVLVKADVSDDTAADKALLAAYRVTTLPTMVLFDAQGRESKRFDQLVDAPTLRAALDAVAHASK
jgi:hypothetical protein